MYVSPAESAKIRARKAQAYGHPVPSRQARQVESERVNAEVREVANRAAMRKVAGR